LFCGKPLRGKLRSKEHIVAAWLQKHLGIRYEQVEFVLRDSSWSVNGNRNLVFDRYLAGHVCEECNTGWMSKLEVAVSKFLPDLISGGSFASDLESGSDRTALARWVAKSAYCVDSASMRQERRVPSSHARRLFEDRAGLPPGVSVLAGRNPFYIPFHVMEIPAWATLVTERTPGGPQRHAELSECSYKIGFQFGHLMLAVYHWPEPTDSIAVVDGVHEPIRWDGEVRPIIAESSYCANTPLEVFNAFIMYIIPVPAGTNTGDQTISDVRLLNPIT